MAHLSSELLTSLARRIGAVTGRDDVADAVTRFLADTAERTVSEQPDGTTYVITGDIPAMWLRDSAAQLKPLLYLVEQAPETMALLNGLLLRHWRYITIDPYANAFNLVPNGNGHQSDHTRTHPIVWERKWEIDSLTYGLDFAYTLWKSGSTDWCDASFRTAAHAIVETFTAEQDHENRSPYRFRRGRFCRWSGTDTLVRWGKGRKTTPTGMVWSAFRPSDDACAAGFNIPGNFYAAQAMRQLEEIARDLLDDQPLATEANRLHREMTEGLATHATVTGPDGTTIYAYEVDGRGGNVLMDDANVPSLLALPYLGCVDVNDPVYQATRKFLLSAHNPYHFTGRAASGIGSPHTPRNHVWPIALAIQGLTATTAAEQADIISLLLNTTGDTGMMHESFHVDDPAKYTREWFSWANAMFCELVLVHCGYRLPSGRSPAYLPSAG
ncbi:MAG: glycoside hydrolase family 125 protein [Actinomycetota bacterium]|nr:glycoside hydrolase family 125 protein [Actinomycetota bacterium]